MSKSSGQDGQGPQGYFPSPSPPPRPPVSLAPGPRAEALQKIFHGALKATLKTVSYENFAACFPTPAKRVPDALSGLHRDFVDRLSEVCKGEFASLMEERDVVRNLNELDTLVEEAEKRREQSGRIVPSPHQVPPHLLPPSSILTAHFNPFIFSQTADMDSQLLSTQRSNEVLAEEVRSQREEIESLLGNFETVVRDLEGAADILSTSGMQALIDGLGN